MSIHDVCWLIFVSKGIEPYIKVPAIVNHVKVDVPSVLSALVLAVLDQRVLTRNSDTNKVRLIKNAFP